MRQATLILTILALCATLALAHGNEVHVMGVVKKITTTSILVETKDNTTVEVDVDSSAKITKNNAAIALKDLREGDRVAIGAQKKGQKLVATTVRVGIAEPSHKSH